MAASMNLLQLLDADLGVDGGGVELLVTEELLDEGDVGPVFQHVRGAGMAEDVAAALALQARLLEPCRDHPAEDIGIECVAVARQKQGLCAGAQAQARIRFTLKQYKA